MRILHLGKFFPPYYGGMEIFLYDLVQAQARMGFEPLVLVHQDKSCKGSSWENCGLVKVCRARVIGNFLYAPLSPEYPIILRRILSQFEPDIVHIHMPNFSPFSLLFLKIECPMVIHWQSDVVVSHIDERLALAYCFYKPFERLLLQKASAIVVTSHLYLSGSLPLRDFIGKCHVIPLGIDPSRVYQPSRREINSLRRKWGGRLRVFSAGRFAYYKGFDTLVDAARVLDGVNFVIAGDGPLRKRIVRKVESLSLGGRVWLPGALGDREFHTYMASCDVFCLSSVEKTESFGLVLLEAMNHKKALITTRIEGSGVTWVNQDGQTGVTVPPGDPEAIARAIKKMIEFPMERERMGLIAYRRFKERFQIDGVARAIADLYRRISSEASYTLGWHGSAYKW